MNTQVAIEKLERRVTELEKNVQAKPKRKPATRTTKKKAKKSKA